MVGELTALADGVSPVRFFSVTHAGWPSGLARDLGRLPGPPD